MKLVYGINNVIRKNNKDGQYYYFGFNFENKQRLLDIGIDLFDTRELISKSAHEIKFDFINYITEIGKKQKNELNWWSSKIASKSNLQTDFFSIVSLLHAFGSNNNIKSRQIAVVTDDLRVFVMLKSNFKFDISNYSLLSALISLLTIVSKKIILLFINRLYFLIIRSFVNLKSRNYLKTHQGEKLFLYSWVEGRSFNNDLKCYNDPYFPNINKFIERQEDLVYFCPYYVKPKFFKKFGKEYQLDGLSNYSSFFKVFNSLLYFFIPKGIKPFKSYNLKSLWFFEVLSENAGTSYVSHIHDFFAWRNFFNKNNGKLVYPFENQPWEKIMILANKKMKLSGVLHTTIHNLLLPFHTTHDEMEYMPTPDEIITNSESTQCLYEEYYGSSKVKIVNAGSLRFNNTITTLNLEKKKPIIGIMLSCIRSQTEEMIADIVKNANLDFQYLIKLHPDLDTSVQTTGNIKIFNGSAVELYEKTHAIVYCSSTSGIEAYCKGIPVFRFRTQYMDLETAENSFSPSIINSIQDISIQDLEFHKAIPLFSELNELVWKEILNPKQ